MILSRTLAKVRIARGERPSWVAAWLPVMADAAALIACCALLFGPFQRLSEAFNIPLWGVITALFALAFIPTQAVLIVSSLWAAKSRFRDAVDDQSTE